MEASVFNVALKLAGNQNCVGILAEAIPGQWKQNLAKQLRFLKGNTKCLEQQAQVRKMFNPISNNDFKYRP